ncbi:hypothetical protein ABH970_007418 [Bradyrhizobium ottawaense]
MRPCGTSTTAAAGDIAPAVLAIGRSDFPKVLIDTLRRHADVGHCMVFALSRAGAATCLLDAGNIPIGGDLGAAYAGHFHESDPNRDALFEGEGPAPIMLPSFAPRMYGARYRKIFFHESGIVDKCATAIWTGDTCFYVKFLPHHGPGPLQRRAARTAPGDRASDRRQRRTSFPAGRDRDA